MIAINIDGKIKVYSTLPKTWGRILNYPKADPQIHYEDGFRNVVTPQVTEGKKLGKIEYDEVNDVFTYPLIDKTAEDLEQEAKAEKEAKRYEIKQKYLDAIAEDNIALNPTDALEYYKPYEPRAYKNKEGAIYKGKPFRNNVEGNTNAPDKGGWTEIK